MGSVIDSSIFIAAERAALDLEAVLRSLPDDIAVISAVTASELLHGVHRASKERHAARERAVEFVLRRFPVIAFDLEIARTHSKLVAERMAAGRPLAEHDLIIAATARHLGSRVITRDARSFSTISGLLVEIRYC